MDRVPYCGSLGSPRTSPPTLEDLCADLERQRRVLKTPLFEDPHPSTSQGIRTGEQDLTLSPSDLLETPSPASHTHDVKRAFQSPHGPGLPHIGKDRD